jgi:hypothetical protein
VRAPSGGTTTGYLLDGDEEIAEYSVSGGTWSLLRRYITGPNIDGRIAHVEGSSLTAPPKTYYHLTHQGNDPAALGGEQMVPGTSGRGDRIRTWRPDVWHVFGRHQERFSASRGPRHQCALGWRDLTLV